MYWDRSILCLRTMQHAVDWHSGQWSELYDKQCHISEYFTPGMGWKGFESLSDNGKEIYNQLVAKHHLPTNS